MFLTCIHSSSCQYFILHYLLCFSVCGLSTNTHQMCDLCTSCYFLSAFVPWERKCTPNRPKVILSNIFRIVYLLYPQYWRSLHLVSLQYSLLYCFCHHSWWLCLWFLPPSISGASVAHPSYYSSYNDRPVWLVSELWTLNDSFSPERPLPLSTFQQLIILLLSLLKCHFLKEATLVILFKLELPEVLPPLSPFILTYIFCHSPHYILIY